MAIISSEILFKLSITTGSSGNASSGTPDGSLGKYISTTVLGTGVAALNNLFDDVSGDENAASAVEYRCFFIHNNNTGLVWQSPYIWISGQVAGGASGDIGIDPFTASAVGSTGAQAVAVTGQPTAPTGVSFSNPTSKGGGLALGNISAGQCKAVWVRRTATNSAALNNDGLTLQAEGDTSA